jgi:hypothetical protein
MTHDPLCPSRNDRSTLACFGCSWIAEIRNDERHHITQTVIAETLAYLAQDEPWDANTLNEWAQQIISHPDTYSCCAFCQEVQCDDDCPMRHVRTRLET